MFIFNFKWITCIYFNWDYVYLSLFCAFFIHCRCFCKSLESSLWRLLSFLGFWFLFFLCWSASCFYGATSCGHHETSSGLNPLVSVFSFLLSNLRILLLYNVSSGHLCCVSWKFSESGPDGCVYFVFFQLEVLYSLICHPHCKASAPSVPLKLRKGFSKRLMPIKICTQVGKKMGHLQDSD